MVFRSTIVFIKLKICTRATNFAQKLKKNCSGYMLKFAPAGENLLQGVQKVCEQCSRARRLFALLLKCLVYFIDDPIRPGPVEGKAKRARAKKPGNTI